MSAGESIPGRHSLDCLLKIPSPNRIRGERAKMKKIEKFLRENGIEYRINRYGNPDYFGDGFSVLGIQIAFYFDGIGNPIEKEKMLTRYMASKKAYACCSSRFGCGRTYRIMTVFDAARLEQHEKAVAEAAERFWQQEHARRMREAI